MHRAPYGAGMHAPRLAVPLLAAVALAGSASPAQAAAPSCGKPRARTVLVTPGLRIVSVPVLRVYRKGGTTVRGRDYFGCTRRPGARAFKVGATYREYATTGSLEGQTAVASGLTSFAQPAGTFLLARTREADLSGSYAERTSRVVDVATGRRYAFFHDLDAEGEEGTPDPAPPVAQRLDAAGHLAAIFSAPGDSSSVSPPPGSSQVVAFSPSGARTVLDEAPAAALPKASLTLAGGVVGWTHDGQARSAPAPS